ncbi:hypothetical protein [Lutimaribacter saemankumensis]|uniref:Uncharacterized protein n=1 Tax=Lutimaribacter saemankumensis TaxID=490829 RepID=A0A1G8RCK9_9RHOB|nr:hypothetical protein [Lutimaribacter saemankumensis]SDJ14659.1 hypothetical protein SAMN05421850_10961 [Lutimaribacter saemankumensis]|tara:strand:+ start:281 stop:484 length:204 start_codon:yes stop_codon:yes gene_type:complete
MILVQALSRGIIAFFVIMSLGIAGMMVRDGVNFGSIDEITAYLPDQDIEGAVDSFKGMLQRRLNDLM